jgi:excisionase family DNA binding protein
LERFLTPSQLAELLGVKSGTVYSWLSRGVDIPHIKIAGTVRFREKAIQDWLLEKERERKKRNFEL